MSVSRIVGISLTVTDIVGTAAFYRDALGLTIARERSLTDLAWHSLHGRKPTNTPRAVEIAVGRQKIELVAVDPLGQLYPAERGSNDQWFQHCALVCGDIAAVAKQLEGRQVGIITKGAPVLLPPNTGSVTAFKFRDPEGHPLELIFFPDGVGKPIWHGRSVQGIVGYDHVAISVADVDRSIAFYTDLLDFRISGRTLNRGPEQDRLDGLSGCEVDVVSLEPTAAATPHLELLHYRTPRGRILTAEVNVSDVASARQIYQVAHLDGLVARLRAEGVRFVSPGVVTLSDGSTAACIRDPDGHVLVLTA